MCRHGLPILAVLALTCPYAERSTLAQSPPGPQPAPAPAQAGNAGAGPLEEAARTKLQLTGVAVSMSGRIFACSPLWHAGAHAWSVAELTPDGTFRPYPSDVWNAWREGMQEHGGIQFVCVQSVVVDDKDELWVLDAASPRMERVARGEFAGGGPKLLRFDLHQDRLARGYMRIPVDELKSYLNDVRIDTQRNIAVITDSGLGCLIGVDLQKGLAKRLLEGHPSVKADSAVTPIVGGRELRNKQGQVPQMNVDGLAMDQKNGFLYYQALTGKRLYRMKLDDVSSAIHAPGSSNWLADKVEDLGPSVMTDGMICDADGNLYFAAIERDAVVVRAPSGNLTTLVQDKSIAWPDSFAIGAGPTAGKLLFTTSQIHLTSWFSADGSMPAEPYRIFMVDLPRAAASPPPAPPAPVPAPVKSPAPAK